MSASLIDDQRERKKGQVGLCRAFHVAVMRLWRTHDGLCVRLLERRYAAWDWCGDDVSSSEAFIPAGMVPRMGMMTQKRPVG